MARSRVLKDIPPLGFGEGRDCTLPACLALATGTDYDWIMGISGAAFSATIDPATWDPLAAAPLDDGTLTRGALAAGTKPDIVGPPFDDEMRALVLDRVAEAIDSKIAPLVKGIAGPPEYGLIVGYDENGPSFLARTYFDRSEKPAKIDWSAFADAEHGQVAFLDRTAAPERAVLARDAVRNAAASAETTERALRAWLEGLRDDTRWADVKHAGAAAFGDHAMRSVLADKRRAAARFLRGARGIFSTSPGADLLRAAESYGFVADACAKIGIGPFDGSVAMRFLDVGHRRAWAKQLEAIIAHEKEAHAALATAGGAMR
ncbi:MAG TPA: hypothetical protein VM052_00950 [Candidatus Limnocylindrales bacterium]|nr:hypothetical protein [Candidatus Limnocylindrales bacterium]